MSKLFKSDAYKAEERMKEICDKLERENPYVKKTFIYGDGKSNEADRIIRLNNEKEFTVEIKDDFAHAIHIENIAIECYSRGKASGIEATKSDLWLHMLYKTPSTNAYNRPPLEDGEFFWLYTQALRDAVKEKKYFDIAPVKRDSPKENPSNTWNYLFKLDYLRMYQEIWIKTHQDWIYSNFINKK